MGFKRILCAVDFQTSSMRAFQVALDLAAADGARLHVVHVLPVPLVMHDGTGGPVLMTEVQEQSDGELRVMADGGLRRGVKVTTETLFGNVLAALRRIATVKPIDLVVMGSHGRSGLARWIVGSVAEGMMRHCPVPLMIVGPARSGALAPKIRHVLAVTDFEGGTAEALRCAASIADEKKGRLKLLHVVSDNLGAIRQQYRDALLAGVKQRLRDLVPPAPFRSEEQVVVVTGLPWRAIPARLQGGRYDLLVMNIHRHSVVDRIAARPVGERIVRAALRSCPVLLVPSARRATQFQAAAAVAASAASR